MSNKAASSLTLSKEVADALSANAPVVALESTVISHGLPYPDNLETAQRLETIIREAGVVPATIAVLDGSLCVGLDAVQIERLATAKGIRKASRRDLAIALANKIDCATTVSTTSYIANLAGVRVFSTGGIGGVHRGFEADVSADLPELAQTPIIVVCSGAKSVLDLPRTREWLETHGVAVLGWQCDEMPAFYSQTSSLAVDYRVDTAADVAQIAAARDQIGLSQALLVTVPVPSDSGIDAALLDALLSQALGEADEQAITGKAVTPFLLSRMAELSDGKTLRANIALLENNARVAAAIAQAITG